MGMLDEILTHNAQYVATRQYESLQTDKFPDKGLAILACMDAVSYTHLTLPTKRIV